MLVLSVKRKGHGGETFDRKNKRKKQLGSTMEMNPKKQGACFV
jgi:hypothetical protein